MDETKPIPFALPKVLIIKNIHREGPGLLKKILRENSIAFDIVDLDNQSFPDPVNYSAIFVFGGPDSANDTTPKMLSELKQIQKALHAMIPYLGICLGMQVLVKAAGGNVRTNETKEVGWIDPDGNYFQIEFTNDGKIDPVLNKLSSPLKIFHLHAETVDLTPKMKLLATGKFCTNQIIKVGDYAYGTQGHFELTPEMFEEWLSKDTDLIKSDKNGLRKNYTLIKDEYENNGRIIFTNFLRFANLIN